MKKFVLKSLAYTSVIVMYIVIGEYYLYRIRENVPLSITIKEQVNSPVEKYYGRTLFGDVISTYKLNSLEERKPNVIALGQSIVLTFRDFFFHPYEQDFYNTGLMIRNISDLIYFKELIKQKKVHKPEFIVLGVDYGFILKDTQLDEWQWFKNPAPDPVLNPKEHIRVLQEIYLDSRVREVAVTDFGYGKKGMEGTGYRRDGSFDFKWELDLLINDSIHNEGPQIDDLKNKRNHFASHMEVSNIKMDLLIKTLSEYESMGIELLLYCPPLSDTFYNEAIKDREFAELWKHYLDLQNRLETMNFDIIKFTTPSRLGLNDYYMNNSDHPGDVIVAKQFYEYCMSNSRKNKFVDRIDLKFLQKKLISSKRTALSFMTDSLLYPGR
jgi:hypothetical protein